MYIYYVYIYIYMCVCPDPDCAVIPSYLQVYCFGSSNCRFLCVLRQMFQETQQEVVGSGSTEHEGSQLLEGLRQLGYTYCNLDAGHGQDANDTDALHFTLIGRDNLWCIVIIPIISFIYSSIWLFYCYRCNNSFWECLWTKVGASNVSMTGQGNIFAMDLRSSQ